MFKWSLCAHCWRMNRVAAHLATVGPAASRRLWCEMAVHYVTVVYFQRSSTSVLSVHHCAFEGFLWLSFSPPNPPTCQICSLSLCVLLPTDVQVTHCTEVVHGLCLGARVHLVPPFFDKNKVSDHFCVLCEAELANDFMQHCSRLLRSWCYLSSRDIACR